MPLPLCDRGFHTVPSHQLSFTHAGVQGILNEEVARLEDRRLDWLGHVGHVLEGRVTKMYIWRYAAKVEGITPNTWAAKGMALALGSARSLQAATVDTHGQGTAIVTSQLGKGAAHTVSGVLAIGGLLTCSCRAGQRGLMCEHVAKVVLLSDDTEEQLQLHLGLRLGSKHGGWKALCTAMQAGYEQHMAAAAGDRGSAGELYEEVPRPGASGTATGPLPYCKMHMHDH